MELALKAQVSDSKKERMDFYFIFYFFIY